MKTIYTTHFFHNQIFKDVVLLVTGLGLLMICGLGLVQSRAKLAGNTPATDVAAVSAAVNSAPSIAPAPYARLTNYYRGMQYQGNVVKSQPAFFTATMPPELTDSALSFPYKIDARGGAVELPYVTNFSIVRALGGHAKKVGDSFVPVKDFDTIYLSTTTKTYAYRIDQLMTGLRYYTALGYEPRNVILTLDNIPWDIAKTECADGSPVTGFYGNRAAIKDMAAYTTLIDKLAVALKTEYGAPATDFRFKLGTEFNAPESSCMTLDEYKQYYTATYKALAKHFSNPKLMPYEQAGSMTSQFDTAALYEWLVQSGMTPVAIPFSSHSIFSAGGQSTIDSTISGFENRYTSVYKKVPVLRTSVKPGLAQFGVLGSPEGAFDSANPIGHFDAFSGAFAFQALMRERKNIDPSFSFHWDVLDGIKASAGPDYPLTTGTSFVYQILDNLIGSDMFTATTTQTPAVNGSRVYSVLFKKNAEYYLVVSKHTDRTVNNNNSSVLVTLPPGLFPDTTEFKITQTSAKNSNLPAMKVLEAINRGAIPGIKVKDLFKNPALLTNIRLMIEPTDGSTIFAAIRKVGDALSSATPLRTEVAAATRDLFTLKPTVGGLMTVVPGGGYRLNAQSFADNEIKVFKIIPQPAPLKSTSGTNISLTPNPCQVEGTSSTCTMDLTLKNNTKKTQQVWVKVDGKEVLVVCSAVSVTRPIKWIIPDKQYTFTTYAATSCNPLDRKEIFETVLSHGLR